MGMQAAVTAEVERKLSAGVPLRAAAPLRARKIIKKSIRGVLAVLTVWGGATAAMVYFAPSQLVSLWLPWLALLGLMLLWRTGYQILYFLSYYYHVDELNLIVRKGVLAQTEITLPFSKITDVYVQQDLLDVLFGLYDVHFSTPTESSGVLAHIDGVTRSSAYALRDIVLKRVNRAARHRTLEPTTPTEVALNA